MNSAQDRLVNAWIFLNGDDPANETEPDDSSGGYKTINHNNVYRPVDILYLGFVTVTPTCANTIPSGDGSSYTIKMEDHGQPPAAVSATDMYRSSVIHDARKKNPAVKIVVTLVWDNADSLSAIFSNTHYSERENAGNFAANLHLWLKRKEIDGFNIDWESSPGDPVSRKRFNLLLEAIRSVV
jgi:hypothetical protein